MGEIANSKKRLYDGLASLPPEGVKETLQDEDCGYLIDHRTAISRVTPGGVQGDDALR